MMRHVTLLEHPFGTIKARMGATDFLMKRLKNVRTEMALGVLAYTLTGAMNIIGTRPPVAAIRAWGGPILPERTPFRGPIRRLPAAETPPNRSIQPY
jgi:hypothetical protein